MALYRDQNDYDSDHNGRLSGSEWLSWYYDTYGNDIQAAERRQNSAFRAQWDTWLNRTAAYVKIELDSAVKNTAILLEKETAAVRKSAVQMYLYWLSAGMIDSGKWRETHHSSTGQIESDLYFRPYAALMRSVCSDYAEICNEDEIFKLAKKRQACFEAVGNLTEQSCGSFWKDLLAHFPFGSFYTNHPEALEDLLALAASGYTFFSDDSDRETALLNKLRETFDTYWLKNPHMDQVLSAIHAHNYPKNTDPYAALLIGVFPSAFKTWDTDDLCFTCARDLLQKTYARDHKTGIAMWRLLLNTAQPYLHRRHTARSLLEEYYPDTDYSDEIPELLDALRDRAFARQVFQSADAGFTHYILIRAAAQNGRRSLAEHFLTLLEHGPLPQERWDASHEELCMLCRDAVQVPQAAQDDPTDCCCMVQTEADGKTFVCPTSGLPLQAGCQVMISRGKAQPPQRALVVSDADGAPTAPDVCVLWILSPPEQPPAVSGTANKAAAAAPRTPAQKKAVRKKILCAAAVFLLLVFGTTLFWNWQYRRAGALLIQQQYEDAATLAEKVPAFLPGQPALLQLAQAGTLLDSDNVFVLRRTCAALKDPAAFGAYQEQAEAIRKALKDHLTEVLYQNVLSALSSGDSAGAKRTLPEIRQYKDAPVLSAYADALYQSSLGGSSNLRLAEQYLEAVPADYTGPFAAEITTLRSQLPDLAAKAEAQEKAAAEEAARKAEEAQKAEAARIAALEAKGIPYVGMSEQKVNSTRQLGTATWKGYAGDENVYEWYGPSGEWVFRVFCRYGVVTDARKWNEDTCWNGDRLLVKIAKTIPTDTGTADDRDTGAGSGPSLRQDYSDPEDLYEEDGTYEDPDEAWDEWSEGD